MKKYVSSISKLGITIAPGRPIYEAGQRVGDIPGKYANFEGGAFETSDQEIIDKLESLPTFGRDFFLASEETPAPQESKGDDLSSLTVPQLKEKALAAGVEIPEGAKKADIITLLTPATQEPTE